MAAADAMVLFRSAAKQVARRNGCLASFMCRPALPNMMSSGWHLHQSLIEHKRKINAFALNDRDVLSTVGRYYLGGLIAHARAGAVFSTPTINGYKRYRPMSLAPDRAIWARDNRGVMVRVIGQPGDPATHLENRIGEPAANPYLYMASQIYAGLDGIARRLDPGPSADAPYEHSAALLPKNLGEALTALTADESVARRLRHAVRRTTTRTSRMRSSRAFRKESGKDKEPGRADRMGAARIFRHVLSAGTRTPSRHYVGTSKELSMLKWAVIFLIIAIIAGIFGFYRHRGSLGHHRAGAVRHLPVLVHWGDRDRPFIGSKIT